MNFQKKINNIVPEIIIIISGLLILTNKIHIFKWVKYMKNILSYIGIFLLIIFSFIITDKVALVIKESDPLMEEINKNKDSHKIDVEEAIITDNTIVPGINGCEIDVNASYENLKRLGSFNSNMLKYKTIYTKNLLSKNYDKYIVSGNESKNNVSLIFKIYNNTNQNNINKLVNILLDNNVEFTMFVDGMFLEDNIEYVQNLINNNIEILNLGYNKKYDKDLINWNNSMLDQLNYNNPKFCYLESTSINDLTVCKNNKINTVIPNIIVDDKPLTTVKNNIKNGSMISFDIDDNVLNEIKLVINYINNKGYKIVKLSNLLSEDNDKCNQ